MHNKLSSLLKHCPCILAATTSSEAQFAQPARICRLLRVSESRLHAKHEQEQGGFQRYVLRYKKIVQTSQKQKEIRQTIGLSYVLQFNEKPATCLRNSRQ